MRVGTDSARRPSAMQREAAGRGSTPDDGSRCKGVMRIAGGASRLLARIVLRCPPRPSHLERVGHVDFGTSQGLHHLRDDHGRRPDRHKRYRWPEPTFELDAQLHIPAHRGRHFSVIVDAVSASSWTMGVVLLNFVLNVEFETPKN